MFLVVLIHEASAPLQEQLGDAAQVTHVLVGTAGPLCTAAVAEAGVGFGELRGGVVVVGAGACRRPHSRLGSSLQLLAFACSRWRFGLGQLLVHSKGSNLCVQVTAALPPFGVLHCWCYYFCPPLTNEMKTSHQALLLSSLRLLFPSWERCFCYALLPKGSRSRGSPRPPAPPGGAHAVTPPSPP